MSWLLIESPADIKMYFENIARKNINAYVALPEFLVIILE